ncbi:hypothetical protein [Kitasatospora sp. NPDC057198]|uniref:hypothetical protein n=1 Tax=Kitasatospora sp. NPDC057198 TaxID=3346046 RepID=UPI00363C6734
MTAPGDERTTPGGNPGAAENSPAEPARPKKFLDRLDNTQKVITGITGCVLALGALWGGLKTFGSEDKKESSSTSSAAPQPSQTLPPPQPGGKNSPEPVVQATPSVQASASATYTLAYENKTLGLQVPSNLDTSTLDLDARESLTYTESEMNELETKAKESNKLSPIEIAYRNPVWGYLFTESKYAGIADSDAEIKSVDDCRELARSGGFKEAEMAEWKVKVGSTICLITDQGSVAEAKITKLQGGDSKSYASPPNRIEFSATLWKKG